MELIFASNNSGKIFEIQSLIPPSIKIVPLKAARIQVDIPEPYDTFSQNAWAKANYIFQFTGKNCFAEDSGLVVPALGGAPGVYSARYAGEPSNDQANNNKLLDAIKDVKAKEAYYQAVICLILGKEIHYFEGKCEGTLTIIPRGTAGFGYDPLFIPNGYDQTFAELPLTEKNRISHRAAAMQQFSSFLNNLDLR